jgi:hypothetical protein
VPRPEQSRAPAAPRRWRNIRNRCWPLTTRQPDLTLDEVVAAMFKQRVAGGRSAVCRFFDRTSFKKKVAAGVPKARGVGSRLSLLDATAAGYVIPLDWWLSVRPARAPIGCGSEAVVLAAFDGHAPHGQWKAWSSQLSRLMGAMNAVPRILSTVLFQQSNAVTSSFAGLQRPRRAGGSGRDAALPSPVLRGLNPMERAFGKWKTTYLRKPAETTVPGL